jgi:hypothetical protein
MDISKLVINGKEPAPHSSAPLSALNEFYRAFNGADLAGLEANWAPGDLPSMDNPIGGIRRGWDDIGAGYARLFGGRATIYVEFHDFTSQGTDDYCLFVGRERGHCDTPETTMELRMRTSRLFVRVDKVWRQLHHHGSIEEPALLANYQRIILGRALGDGP